MLKKMFRDLILGAQGTRTGAIVSTLIGMASKPVGYVRILLLAWLFGASAGMDAFYLSLGILGLICQIVQSVSESALLPRLIRLRASGASESLMSSVCAVCAAGVLAAGGFVFFFPELPVRFFARRFDPARLSLAAKMLRILVPWAVGSIFLALLGVWNNYRERYSLTIGLSVLGYATMIPLIFLSAGVLGIYSVPTVYSLVLVFLTIAVWRVTEDFPFRAKGAPLPRGAMKSLGLDSLLCLGIVGASSLYQLVDRYFAAGLPEGNIAAINYAGQIYMLPLGLLAPTLMIYLNRASVLAENAQKAQEHLGTVMSMSWLYLFPPSAVLAGLAEPIVKLLLGYGAFDAAAVGMTAPCVTAAAGALPLLLWGQVLARYAQACGKLKMILLVSYGALFLNALLDWALVPHWGAPGLCLATAVTWGGSALVYSLLLVKSQLLVVLRQVWGSTMFFSATAWGLYLAELPPLVSLGCGGGVLAVYYLLGERLGAFAAAPAGWRPLALLRVFLSRGSALTAEKNER